MKNNPIKNSIQKPTIMCLHHSDGSLRNQWCHHHSTLLTGGGPCCDHSTVPTYCTLMFTGEGGQGLFKVKLFIKSHLEETSPSVPHTGMILFPFLQRQQCGASTNRDQNVSARWRCSSSWVQ